jgi:hypothetical protein
LAEQLVAATAVEWADSTADMMAAEMVAHLAVQKVAHSAGVLVEMWVDRLVAESAGA